MEKTTLGLLVALGAAAVAPAANAAVPAESVLKPTSVAELLEPVANPVATLDALNSGRQLEAVEVADSEPMQVAETVVIRRHHHHHHFWRHHHHHHHHFWRRHHHHHHHMY